MLDIDTLVTLLGQFLTTPDKGWSLCTFPFLVTFLCFFTLYVLIARLRRGIRLSYVVLFSLFFAWKANGTLMVLLPATALVTWWLTRRMTQSETHRKAWLATNIVVTLLPLIYFKYTNFLALTINAIIQSNFGPFEILLPVGISFYTFQAISYAVDVYKGKYPGDTPLVDYLFYLTFFPLLMAGPITRAEVLLPQIQGKRRVSTALVYGGLWLILCGLLKKAVIADYIAQYNNWVFDDPMGYSGFENLMAVIGFTLQIYCDFSGYSDMAIGLAGVMGFELKENFCFPYQSINPQEFWRRWHIALSTWFRDYLYIPLGGNRKGTVRTSLNNLVTMLVAGLWHGASWMFVIWGGLWGVALVGHKLCRRWFLDRIPNTWVVKTLCWVVMFAFVNVTWVFFRADSLNTVALIWQRIVTDLDWAYFQPFVHTRLLWMVMVAVGLELHSIRQADLQWMRSGFIKSPWMVKLIFFAIVIQLVISTQQGSIQPFIYARF